MSVASYINYHRKPFQQFVSIADYNERHGTSIPANQAFESAFQSALSDARRVTDPHDYIQHHFNVEKMRSKSARGLTNPRSKKDYGGGGKGIGNTTELPSDSGDVSDYTPREIEDAINKAYERGAAIEEAEREAEMKAIKKKQAKMKGGAKRRGSPSSRKPSWTRYYDVEQKVWVYKGKWKEGIVRSKTGEAVVVRFEDGYNVGVARVRNSPDETIDDQTLIESEEVHAAKLEREAVDASLEDLAAREAAQELSEAIEGAERQPPRKGQGKSNSETVTALENKPVAAGEDIRPTSQSAATLGLGDVGSGRFWRTFGYANSDAIGEWYDRVVINMGVRSIQQMDELPEQDKKFYTKNITNITQGLEQKSYYIADVDRGVIDQCLFLAQIPITESPRRTDNQLARGPARLPWDEITSVEKLGLEVKRLVKYYKTKDSRKTIQQAQTFATKLKEFDNTLTSSDRATLLQQGRDKYARLVGVDSDALAVRGMREHDSLDAALEGEYDDETLPAASSAAPQAVPSTPAVAPAAPAPKAPSLHEEINAYLRTGAKDESAFERDRAHVVHFNTTSMNLPSRLMKGRDRYMKRLQAYVDGDASVKVRMMDNKEVLVSSLKPNMASLKKMLAASSGAPRFCDCA